MTLRKIKDIAKDPELAALANQAKRGGELAAAIKEALPEWLDANSLDCRIDDQGVLEIVTSATVARQVKQILPILQDKLQEFGVRRATVRFDR